MIPEKNVPIAFRSVPPCIALIIIFSVSQGIASATNYYVSNEGNDHNSGLTDANAWANHPWMSTWTGQAKLKPGDTIFMKRDNAWCIANPENAFIVVQQNGTKRKHIVTTWYGNKGTKPLIRITADNPNPVIMGIGNSYLTFDHLDIMHYSSRRSESGDNSGISLGKDGSEKISHDWVITNCDIHEIPHTGIEGSGDSYNIFIGDTSATSCATSSAYSNHIYDCGYAGVGMGGFNPVTRVSNWKVYFNYINRIDYHSRVEQDSYGIAFSSAMASSGWPTYCYARFNLVEDVINWHGIDAHGGENIYFQDNYIRNCRGGIIAFAADREGLATPVMKHCFIERNTIENSGDHPTKYYFSIFVGAENKKYRVSDCHITDNSVFYTTRPSGEGAAYGIYILSADDVIIEGNHILNGPIHTCSGAIHVGSADSPAREIMIRKNFIHNWSWAINLDPEGIDGDVIIQQNVIYSNNRTIGSSTTGAFAGNIKILSNTILMDPKASAPYVIYFQHNPLPHGKSLIINNNIIGFISNSYLGKYVLAPSSVSGNLDIDYNLYWNCKNIFPFNCDGYSTWAHWNSKGHDRNGLITTNPGFRNLTNRFVEDTDFNIYRNSPAFNRGRPLGLESDYTGSPIKGQPDIGAFEIQ
jgi:hypothetical protein